MAAPAVRTMPLSTGEQAVAQASDADLVLDTAATKEVEQRGQRSVLLVSLSAAVGSLLFGYDTGVISGALLYIEPEFGLEDDPALIGLIVSATLIGAFLGALSGGRISDAFGRRRPLFVTALLFIGGGLLMALAPTVALLITGRFLVGVAIGVSGTIIPVYIAECAPSYIRGRLATFPQLFVSLGIFTSYLVDFAVSLSESGSWRWMLGVSIVPAAVQFALLLWLPESPRWLVQQGRWDMARLVLQRLRLTDDVEDEIQGIRDALIREATTSAAALAATRATTGHADDDGLNEPLVAQAHVQGPSPASDSSVRNDDDGATLTGSSKQAATTASSWAAVWAALSLPQSRQALAIGFGLQMFQQLSGVNATIYYTPTILQEAGVTDLFAGLGLSDESAAILAATLTYFLKIPSILISMQLIDRLGRRTLLIATVPVLSLALAGLSIAFSLPEGSVVRPILSMLCVAVYGCAFSAALGPIPNILCSEIFPPVARAVGLSVCVSVQWAFNIMVSQTFPILLASIGEIVTFAMFSTLCALAAVFVYLVVPETKGYALDDIAAMLVDDDRPRKIVTK